jgi:hypothetical protein
VKLQDLIFLKNYGNECISCFLGYTIALLRRWLQVNNTINLDQMGACKLVTVIWRDAKTVRFWLSGTAV